MVHYCVAYNCKSKPNLNNKSVSFHRFPLSRPEILQKWVKSIRRENFQPTKFSRICSNHFTDDSYQVRPGAATKRLKEDAVPTVFSYNSHMKRPVKKRRVSPRQIPGAPNSECVPNISTIKISKAYGGNRCSIGTCQNNAAKAKKRGLSIRFFGFPKNRATRRAWIVKCHRKDVFNPETARICSEHFREEDFEDTLKAKLMGITPKKLKKTAVPSLLLSSPKSQCNRTTKRLEVKKQKEVIDELLAEHEPGEKSKVHIINLSTRMPGETVCSVVNCKRNSERAEQDIRFFAFPHESWLKEEWVKACRQKDNFDPKLKKVCSLHFQKDDYEDGMQAQVMNYFPKKLKKDAVPSVNLSSASEPGRTTLPVVSTTVEEKINSTNLRKELVEECLKQYHEILQVKNTPNEGKETVSYLNTRELQPGTAKKRINYSVKFNRQLAANGDDQYKEKKTGFIKEKMQSSSSEMKQKFKGLLGENRLVQHKASDDDANQERVWSNCAKKRKRSPVKLQKLSVEDSTDDESFSDINEIARASPLERAAGYSKNNHKDDVVSFVATDDVTPYEVSRCSNRNCQMQFKALEHKLTSMKKECDSRFEEMVKERFKGFLSANQVSVALNKKTKPFWTQEDMSKAFSILQFSKPCYLHLRNTLHHPLPGLSTLCKWASATGKAWPVENDALNQSTNESENLSAEADVHDCRTTNSDHLPDGYDNSDERFNITEQQMNNFHSAQYNRTGAGIPTNLESKSNENLNPEHKQIETSENFSNDSKDMQSKCEYSKNAKPKCKRVSSTSTKKFKFQSYLMNYLNKKNKVALLKSSTEKETPYSCFICQQVFDKHIALQRHYKIHIPKDQGKCK